jgi:hypothetical protein
MSDPRIDEINRLLNTLAGSPIYNIPRFSDQVYEIFCYLRKIEEFRQNGKRPVCRCRSPGVFVPLRRPGNIPNGDYFQLMSNTGTRAYMDIFLNGTFEGQSGICHSPDIVLTDHGKVVTFYECKNYSGRRIGPGIYRELIGYCKEFKCRKNAYNDFFDVMTPALYTSGSAGDADIESMKDTYNVIIKEFFR